MALGIPVVTLRIHDDYDDYPGAVFVADTNEEFLSHINYLKNLPEEEMEKIKNKCLRYARENSSDKRAGEFMEILNNLNII